MINTEDQFADAVVERTRESLAGVRRLGVAFSGGVDSSVLVALAVRALGVDRVVPILGVSPSLSAEERLAAHQVPARSGLLWWKWPPTRVNGPPTSPTARIAVSLQGRAVQPDRRRGGDQPAAGRGGLRRERR